MLDVLSLLAQAAPFPTTPAPGPAPTSPAELAIGVVILFVVFGLFIFAIYLMYSALGAVPPEHRKMEPGLVWLLLIPVFNLVWIFFVVLKIPESYQSLFYSRGRTDVGDAGRGLGLAYAICAVVSMGCSIIPCIGGIPALATLVLLILFLVKISSLKSQIPHLAMYGNVPGAFPVGFTATAAAMPPPPPYPSQFPLPPPPLPPQA